QLDASLAGNWSTSATTVNDGVVTFNTDGHNLNLSSNAASDTGTYNVNVTANDTTVTNASSASLTDNINLGATSNDTVVGFTSGDSITGTGSNNTLQIGASFDPTATQISGIQTIHGTAKNISINLSNLTGNFNIEDTSAGGDNITANNGADTITVAKGDAVTGGTGGDTFVFGGGAGDGSGSSVANTLTGLISGDTIQDAAATLVVGGTSAAATKTIASIDSTGDATFNTATSTTLFAEVAAIVQSFADGAGGEKAGDFAFFTNGGTEYLFISGTNGATSATGADTLIQLVGVSSEPNHTLDVNGIHITSAVPV
ncbi:MAG: hypothetical protein ABSB19_12700, partial [Methylomonas sp.]